MGKDHFFLLKILQLGFFVGGITGILIHAYLTNTLFTS
jgi:hypothetical protein